MRYDILIEIRYPPERFLPRTTPANRVNDLNDARDERVLVRPRPATDFRLV